MSVDVNALPHDDVTRMLATQIEAGIAEINSANEVLLADESGTGVRDIDKAFKEGNVEDKEAVKAWEKAEKAREEYKKNLDAARNLYRTKVLGEEEIHDSEVDKDEVKTRRKLVMESVNLLKTYAQANGRKEIVAWAETLAIPQVGRQGSSNVGQKKPRAHVRVNGNLYDSFGEAAKAVSAELSTDDNKVTVSSGDLVSAWDSAGEAASFEFQGLTVEVTLKNKDKAAA